MKLSIADKLALIYTSAGSMRKVAGITGLSHQKVSRIMHRAFDGGSVDYWERQLETHAAVEVAFDIHKDLARGVARRHELPFDGSIPVYAERMALKNHRLFVDDTEVFKGTLDEIGEYIDDNELEAGEYSIKRMLGDRVGALHLHWLSDRLRNHWLESMQKTSAYVTASVGSLVNLPGYMQAAAKRINDFMKRGGVRTAEMIHARESLRLLVKDHVKIARIFTPYSEMNAEFPPGLLTASIDEKLQSRHAPAVDEPGTRLADQIMLQLDTRKVKNAKPGKKAGNRTRRR